MKKINKKVISEFLKELPILQNEKIITDNTSNEIKKYYSNILESKKLENKAKNRKALVIILSVISAILIGGGSILLIGYNWDLLSKNIKTVIAFVLLLIPQGIMSYFLFFTKKGINKGASEGLTLIWGLMFGAVIALISQIYKMPSNLSLFLLIWALSSLGITYILNSVSTLILYLILIISSTISMQLDKSVGLIFYPMFALLIPFFISVNENGSLFKKTLIKYLLIASLIIGLGISIEKAVPGIWILLYSNLFIMFALLAFFLEKKETSVIISPLKVSGVLGLLGISLLFTLEWVWEDIGWLHYRGGGNFNHIASVFDYTAAIFLFSSNIFLAIKALLEKNERKNYLILLLLIVFLIPLLFVLTSTNLLEPMITTWIVTLFLIFSFFYFIYSGYFAKIKISSGLLIFLFSIPILVKFIILSNKENSFEGFWFLGISVFFVMLYFFGRLYENTYDFILFKIYKIIGILGIVFFAFLLTWSGFFESIASGNNLSETKEALISLILVYASFFIFFLGTIFVLFFLIKNKIPINLTSFLFPLFLILIFLIIKYKPGFFTPDFAVWFIYLFILAFCSYGFYLGFSEKSLLIINSSAAFLFITIVSLFLKEDMSLLIRGLTFIFCGIGILVVNILFAKKIKRIE